MGLADGHDLAAELAGEARRLAAEIARMREKLQRVSASRSDASGAEVDLAALCCSVALRENAASLLSEAISFAEEFDDGGMVGPATEEPVGPVPGRSDGDGRSFELAD
ncbi:unnamed protein product [Polarella glacialis]|uniref:Uncharacterized protein n=1 Tax=Polarella glacialis TaxID=89957 RepID=A0A813JLU9_POLGL|nr:unnamed protein product [Polarella glacialis]|mmetsp:Transcript_58365/g.94425  ORF Transcript_58365/g.94425 Transcript_58365/m.94425 type:complete len:108 (-) Transcript_58365:33-356(-)